MTPQFKNISDRPSENEWAMMTKDEKRAELKRRETRQERLLAEFMNVKDIPFDVQVPIGCYFADFQLIPHKLIIEVDGLYHNDMTQKLIDIRRSEYIKKSGFSIIRVTNDQIEHNITGVVAAIQKVLAKKTRKRRSC